MQEPPSQTEHPGVEQISVYGSTVLLGAGGSILLVTSLSMVADLIGPTVVHEHTVSINVLFSVWVLSGVG